MGLDHKPNKLDDELCFAIYTTQKIYNKFYVESLKEYGLTYPQYITLLSLWENNEPMMIKELGKKLNLDNGTLTPLLRRMEKEGWVDRKRSKEDARKVYICLSRKARIKKCEIKQKMTSCFSLVDMTADEYRKDVNLIKSIGQKISESTEVEGN
ncbi:MAG: MarR family transcriptional regulator [Liquorilactobacillus nagelii]|jgi:DNA-binding MarR family transcriptional regulator|uniref:HTH-type transcriptional regulator SarZ n=1 Tax=Liquorilactobacillus nagelii TaxID=82688 RepID=A0A3Q8CDX3_9LACO|nr:MULTISPECIES: MarR family transcriptional regulator [Lactobacillales]AUJ33119.1 MarR family transcriptional regulator [Liquorilactobacillus nagelii]KRL42278.1 MarR family transcriptional regulator [Liquorilactobacillus nagelii DSM 13675]MCC7616514.1 MarR family transcriptional regulator [Liquorilactobacillus nagelii]MCI1698994.1 MarR family transcriptional regulator [Liquorilactobacillus nagelii]MCI1819974.1 MarR family transcriptional regulator [Carnobacterium maltaromaticum]